MKYLKKIILPIIFSAVITQTAFADYEWAISAVTYCVNTNIITGNEQGELMLGKNITRAEMAKMIVSAFSIKTDKPKIFTDNTTDKWFYRYVNDFSGIYLLKSPEFCPDEPVTREEFVSYLIIASNLGATDLTTNRLLETSYIDSDDINTIYKPYILTAVKYNFMKGSDMKLNPKGLINRVEACAFFYRIINRKDTDNKDVNMQTHATSVYMSSAKNEETIRKESLGNKKAYNNKRVSVSNYDSYKSAVNNKDYTNVPESQTPIVGEPSVTLEQAKQWAVNKKSHQRFIDIADYYWYYGNITGIRPEILYAQAAKETNYGKYTGKVVPEQNNWAGIKTKNATGDTTYDHESFATPEDGVRAHFNHMCAYIGLEPLGTPHGRYYSVKSLSWAGTVRTVEELGGKWAPHPDYGVSIMTDYVYDMQNTKY